MKCSYCGNHLEKEAQFCPECGTILGADIDDNYEDFDTQVLEQESNVFSAPLVSEPSQKEAEIVEEKAEVIEESSAKDEPVIEATPVVSEVFETEISDEASPVQEEVPAVEIKKEKKKNKKNKKKNKNQAIAIEKYEEAFEPQEAFSNSADVKEEELPEQPQEVSDIYSFSEEEQEPVSEESDKTQSLSEPQDTYNVFQTLPEPEVEEEQEPLTSTFETYEEPAKKKKKPFVAFLIMILIAAVCAAFAMNYDTIISALPETETTEEVVDTDATEEMTEVDEETTADEDETEIEDDEDEIEEDTTVDETEDETTTAAASTTTAAATTTTAAATTTTQAATTTTQAATTTTAAATTTTQAATTTTTASSSSTTTDPYGIGDATVQTPSSTVTSYTVYVQTSGLMIISEPSSSGERIIYVEKGADLTVSGKQDGYLYVYSNRIGVYGWISESSVATNRPVEETTASTSGIEQPDTVYDEYITMYVSPSVGLNLRSGPSTSYDVIKNIQQNYQVQVVGYNSDDPSWVYVIDTTFGVTGWVSLEYLSTSEVR